MDLCGFLMSRKIRIISPTGEPSHYETKKQVSQGIREGRLKMISEFEAADLRPVFIPRIERARTVSISPGYAIRISQREARNARQSRISRAAGFHTEKQWLDRVSFHGWRCKYCNVQLSASTVTKDHQIPIVCHGSEWAANLVPACRSCNSWKGSRKVRTIGS